MKTSTSGKRDPYTRKSVWLNGIVKITGERVAPPLVSTFLQRDTKCLGKDQTPAERVTKMIQNFDFGEWITKETKDNNPDYYMNNCG
jgi:hypothetical protein